MTLTALSFYLFATVAVASAFMVISARNPVYSVLFLILTFFNSAGLFVLMGAEFLAMILVVVYVGAVAVLFLFVVMMLDIDFAELNEGFLQYMPIGATVGFILLLELLLIFGASTQMVSQSKLPQATPEGMTNAEAIGRVLYTDYIYFFQAAGAVLLVAMIGAIVLTLVKSENPRRQSIAEQNARTREDGVELVDIEPGKGL
ncbi:MAG: NADH:ubiquinone oxidoreductase subunit J [Rhizobiales bacterium TMED143]|nr:NADH:ubiquinone oxidoreductase subunit J [Rhodobiaceae bacterium]OUV92453.1 MAG: NADH:ubiquinone oxidoreductase subunit J [Rhizobiales bacterium TMED143]CAI8362371.1 MAG: NADH-quinone oxidoreductase subunit J [Rhodobiaceae bacterium UBA7378]|tara:strand:- start:102 stop:707 length:606 start_codon:yes stop_codon:yes gene_type:complete